MLFCLVELVKKTQGRADIGSLGLGRDTQQFPDNVESLLSPFFGRDISFYLIAVKNNPYFIGVINRGKTKHGRYFSSDIPFRSLYGPKQ